MTWDLHALWVNLTYPQAIVIASVCVWLASRNRAPKEK